MAKREKCMIKKIFGIVSIKFFYGCYKLDFYHITKLRYDIANIILVLSENTQVTVVQLSTNDANHRVS